MRSFILLAFGLLGVGMASAQTGTAPPDAATTQTQPITGRVVAATGEPIVGATVTLLSPTGGVLAGGYTDANGNFSLTADAPTGARIRISYVGYARYEAPLTGTTTGLAITMQPDDVALDEVVVTALGIERRTQDLGYRTQQVEGAEVNQGRTTNALNSLQGKVAGVQITQNSGGPGSSSRVVIRGTRSVAQGNQPLIIVDGVPVNNQSFGSGDNLNLQVDPGNRGGDIPADDIASINILKGPAAAALYGSQAGNGAIIITTKRGRNIARRQEVSVTSSVLFESVLRLPEFQNDFGAGQVGNYVAIENTNWGPRFDGQPRRVGVFYDPATGTYPTDNPNYPGPPPAGWQAQILPYSAQPDNIRDFFDTGITTTNNISFSGAGENSDFRLSYTHLDNKGIVPTTRLRRHSFSVNGGARLANKLSVYARANYINQRQNNVVQGQQGFLSDLYQQPRNADLQRYRDINSQWGRLEGYYNGFANNPYWYLNRSNSFFDNEIERFQGSAEVKYDATDWLTLTGRLGADVFSDNRYYGNATDTVHWRYHVYGISNDPDGFYRVDKNNTRQTNADLFATVRRQLSEDISLDANVGLNIQQTRTDAVNSSANALTIERFYSLNNVSGNPQVAQARSLFRFYGAFADVLARYQDWLAVGGTVRNDWISTLGQDNRSFFYWSANSSVTWSQFLGATADEGWFNLGRFRIAYSVVGQGALTPYAINALYLSGGFNNGFVGSDYVPPVNGVSYFTQSGSLANLDLQNEENRSLELGLELGFLRNRLGLDLTLYQTNSVNQIVTQQLPPSSGFTARLVNLGEVRNRGIEVTVTGTPIQQQDGLTWTIAANFSANDNEVLSLGTGDDYLFTIGGFGGSGITQVATPGRPVGTFYGTDFQRDPNGNVVVSATTGIPLIDNNPKLLGNTQPKFIAGLNNQLSYRNFRLSFTFDARVGGVFYSGTKSTLLFAGAAEETAQNGRQPFVVNGSVVRNTDGSFSPNSVPVTNIQQYWSGIMNTVQSNLLVDASFVKFREVALTWTLPAEWLERTPFGSASITAVGRNLWLWTPDANKYGDPEVSSFGAGNVTGFEFFSTPSTRSYGLTVQFTF